MIKINSPNERNRSIRTIKYLLFSASIIPSIVGGSIAFSENKFSPIIWLVVSLALFIGQAGGDYLYYYFTNFHSDQRDSHTKIFTGWKPLFSTYFPNDKFSLWAGLICLTIDLIIGIYFVFTIGYEIAFFAVFGGIIAIFFTPLMLRGLKEPVIFITFGPLCIYGVYYALAHKYSFDPLLASLPIGFLVTVVAYLKGTKFEISKKGGNDMVIKLNRKRIFILYFLGYLSLIIPIIIGIIPIWTILGLISIPIPVLVIKVIKDEKSILNDYLWAVVKSIIALVLTGLAISIGYIIS